MQRSLLKYENAIKSVHTKKVYNHYLTKFLEWSKIKDSDGLLQLKDSFLQELLEDYLFYLKKRLSPNTIPVVFAGLELFFIINDKNLNFKKLRKMFPERVKPSGKDAWKIEDIQKMLKYTKSKRLIALIHLIASTGCRIGAIPSLTLKNIEDMPYDCKSVLFYEKNVEEYYGFLTPEASKALQEYLDQRKSDGETFNEKTPLFRQVYSFGKEKAKPLSVETLKVHLFRLSKSANLQREKEDRRFNVQISHGIRKFYATTLKNNDKANPSLVEKLLGHKGLVTLDSSYHRPIKDVLFDEFKKHILNLTIDPTERLRVEKERLQGEISEKDTLKQELKNQRQEIDSLKQLHSHHISLIKAIREDPEFAKAFRDALLYTKPEDVKASIY